MTRPIGTPLVRAAVVVLVLAVVLCMVLPTSGHDTAGMHFVVFCCFVLAIALGALILRRPEPSLLISSATEAFVPLARGPTRSARAPDILILGSLLI